MNRQWLALGLGITISVLTGCGEAEPSGGPTGTIRLSLTAVNSGNAALSVPESATIEKQNGASCAATYHASFGHSGAPDSLTVHVRRIALASSESAPAILFESDDPAGAPLELDSGRLDLSALVSFDPELAGLVDTRELRDGTLKTDIRTGRYDRIDFDFSNRALVSGCLNSEWSGVRMRDCGDGSPGAGKCEPMSPGAQTFCTRASLNTLELLNSPEGISRTDYTGGSPETAEVPMSYWAWSDDEGRIGIGGDPNANVRVSFPTPLVELDSATDLDLTLALDLNTRLAFEANTRPDGTNPLSGEVTNKSFFYLRNLADSSMAFLGAPGEIHGYSVSSCYFYQDKVEDPRAVASWMTVIFDPEGNVMAGNVSPIDEAGFVLLKGGIMPSNASEDGLFDLLFCGGYDREEGPSCSQLRSFRPLEESGSTEELSSDNMTPNAGPESDRGNWVYTREL